MLNRGAGLLRKAAPAPAGYIGMDKPLRFTISGKGNVTLDKSDFAELEAQDGKDKLTYTITVKNIQKAANIRVIKVDQKRMALEDAVFNMTGGKTLNDLRSKIPEGDTDAIIYADQELPIGSYTLHEAEAPDGFNTLTDDVVIQVVQSGAGVTVTAKTGDKEMSYPDISWDEGNHVWTVSIMNSQGVELPHAGGAGTQWIYVIGLLLAAFCGIALVAKMRME